MCSVKCIFILLVCMNMWLDEVMIGMLVLLIIVVMFFCRFLWL